MQNFVDDQTTTIFIICMHAYPKSKLSLTFRVLFSDRIFHVRYIHEMYGIDGSMDRRCFAIVTNERALLSK